MRIPRTLSLTQQINLGLISVVVLSLFITGGILTYLSFHLYVEQLHIVQQERAESAALKVDAYMNDLQRKLVYLSRVRGLASFDVQVQYQLLEGLARHNRAYLYIGLTNQQGQLQASFSDYGASISEQWGNTTAFQRAFHEYEDYIGLVELDTQSQLPTLLLAVPVRDTQNRVEGMLFAAIDLKYLWAVLDEMEIGQQGYVYMLDQRQLIIAHSGNIPQTFIFEDISQNPLRQNLASQATTYKGLHDTAVLGGIATVPLTHWQVVIELPLREAYAPLYEMLLVIGLGLLLSFVAAVCIGLLISRRIVSPLRRLTQAVVELGQGQLPGQIDVYAQNEIGVLVTTFNQMAAQLRESINQLQIDIEKRKAVESALSQSEQMYRLLADNITDMVSLHQPDRTYVYASPSWEKITGYTLDDLKSLDTITLLHPDEIVSVREQGYSQAVAGMKVTRLEFRLKKKSGDYIWVESFAQPVLDTHGKVMNILVSTRDISTRKAQEITLRRTEANLRAVLNSAWQTFTLIDRDYAIVDASEKSKAEAQAVTGKPMLIGSSILDYVRDEDRSGFEHNFAQALAGTSNQIEKILLIHGKTIYFEFRYYPVVDGQGQTIGVCLSSENITSRRLLEQQKEALLQSLEMANRDLKDFAYVISHDLKAPLRGIGSVAMWLESDYEAVLDVKGQEMLEMLIRRVKRMEALINGVLDYSRIGRVEEFPRQVNLEQLVQQTVDLVVPHDQVAVHVTTPLPSVYADPTRLQQIFQNLLSNAVKFMDKPHPEIQISCTDTGSHWCFAIQDNGTGIAERHFQRIFQIFQTLTPRDTMESTGIGLTLVKRIVENLGGQVWVASTLGVGSTFYFTLPRSSGGST